MRDFTQGGYTGPVDALGRPIATYPNGVVKIGGAVLPPVSAKKASPLPQPKKIKIGPEDV